MLKVQSFYEPDIDKLELSMNQFFENAGQIVIVDIKYAIEHNAVAVDTETGVYPQSHYTALVIYEPYKNPAQLR